MDIDWSAGVDLSHVSLRTSEQRYLSEHSGGPARKCELGPDADAVKEAVGELWLTML